MTVAELSPAQKRQRERQTAAMVETRKHYAAIVERVKAYIAAHYDRNPGLNDLAKFAGMSPFHFHRIFAEVAEETPKQCVDRHRIEDAKRQLLAGEDIGEVARALNFAHQSHFTSRFKRIAGLPPAKWLKQARAEQAVGEAA